MTRKIKIELLFTFFILILFVYSCKKDSELNTDITKTRMELIYDVMDEWYLWPEEINNVSSASYTSYKSYMSDLRAKKDRWSYAQNLQELLAYLEKGATKGFGFDIAFARYDTKNLNNNDLRVKIVYDDSELKGEGITRSWRISKINNVSVTGSSFSSIITEWKKDNCYFEFIKDSGTIKKLNLTRKDRAHNTVIYKHVKTYEGVKIAYLVFDSFLAVSKDELNEAFSYFRTQNAQQIIIDLRYNGGGKVSIANQLAGLISGNKFKDKVFSKEMHRSSKSEKNRDNLFTDQTNAIDFSKVVFITSGSTASSSELVINGLKPYLGDSNVILVGSKTHGKPVGMYVFSNKKLNLAILPISFSSTNAHNKGEYYSGIDVDYKVVDNLKFTFGDINEDRYKVAVDILTNKTIVSSMLKTKSNLSREVPIIGIKNNIGAVSNILEK